MTPSHSRQDNFLDEQLLTTPQAAHRLNISPRTLERYRCRGSGPVFRKMGGRVLYHVDDIRYWIENVACKSTSEDSYEKARVIGSRRRGCRP
ncbi:helix-turn-helix domain-containing protein [Komagataeibacter oboediens]|uniref:helix-turn-helix transcriptional regulator n=1 Tax=Komagataeibacter oboediens TaxID=65958 RepID=UPI001C2BD458|nr:helix-turn-helix domain-containing protein [Komagataeibacter oboediens]MBV0888822.1 helix-turn-helix domain-containing protein [Komagataeibacter oboediens]MCK9821532.1 helix-turn-helix domain-containing protein [Komagataeibacter oboediens]